MSETLKIAIPMAGLGTRMRPHTWSKPKPLIALAGRTVLDYVLEQFSSVPESTEVEFVFIVGPQGEQIQEYMARKHPDKVCHYVVQAEMRGQSHALSLAREYLHGPMLMAFSDTLVETDLSFLKDETADGVAWVKPVEDPRRFGVVEQDAQGKVTRLIEKPQDITNNLVAVGFYYFRESANLIAAIDEQMRQGMTMKNEFFLADALNLMLKSGANFRTEQVSVWLDAGVPESLLETNRYLLDHGHDNSAETAQRPGVNVIPPVFVHPNAVVERSVIGPHVSIGEGCHIQGAIIQNAIIAEHTQIKQMILEQSLIGQNVHLEGQSARLSLGDNSWKME